MWNEEEFSVWVEIIKAQLSVLPNKVWYQDFDYCDEDGIYEIPQPTTCVVDDSGATVANCSDIMTACFIGNARRDMHRLLSGVSVFRAERDDLRKQIAGLQDIIAGYEAYHRQLNEAFNTGDGSYHP